MPALVTPFIIVGGKVFGWFTATESAAIAVLYAGALSLVVYREMNLAGLRQALLDTGKLSALALFCVGTASAFGWLLAYYQIPKALLAGVSAWGMGATTTGFFIAGVFLVVGCFLDAIPAIIIVGTILQPLAQAAGMDPVHFAIVGIVSLAFGLVTPPVRAVPDGGLRGGEDPHGRRAEGHDDHAGADAAGAGGGDPVAQRVAVPAAAVPAGHVVGRRRDSLRPCRDAFVLRPCRDAGHLVPRDWAASLTLLRRSLRGRAVSLMGRARACTVPSLEAFSALALPAGREARRPTSRSTRYPASRPGRRAVWREGNSTLPSPCHSEHSEQSQSSNVRDPLLRSG